MNMTMSEQEQMRQDMKLYKITIHHGVVRLLDYFETKDYMYLIFEREDLDYKLQQDSQKNPSTKNLLRSSDSTLEVLERLTLRKFMKKEYQRFELTKVTEREPVMSEYEKFVVDIAKKIGQTLEYLHTLGVVVRDFDYDNIVITQTDQVWPQFMNIQSFTCIGPEMFTESIIGDIRFKAPEVLAGEPYTDKADIWTFGIVIFYLLTFHLPFKRSKTSCDSSENINFKEHDIKSILLNANLSETAVDLLYKVFNMKHEKRSSITSALKHPWFQKQYLLKKSRRSPAAPAKRKSTKEP